MIDYLKQIERIISEMQDGLRINLEIFTLHTYLNLRRIFTCSLSLGAHL